ncbi:MAG: ArsR family transcriptional regulator [Haloarculaceae archaeon]
MRSNELDACLRVIADGCRRRMIQQLRREADGTMSFEDLVGGLQSASDDDRRRNPEQIAIDLEHTHLPKLANHGVVEYDRRSGAVRYRPDEHIEAILDALPEEVLQTSL